MATSPEYEVSREMLSTATVCQEDLFISGEGGPGLDLQDFRVGLSWKERGTAVYTIHGKKGKRSTRRRQGRAI